MGENSAHIISSFQFEYLFYIGSGFLFILLFWSGAIIHAISFVDWPPDLGRNFLYFLASFIEILVFTQLDNPLVWFFLSFIFFVVAGILYVYDLTGIKKEKTKFSGTLGKKKLYDHILKEQCFEFYVLIPLGLTFCALSFLLINGNKNLFLDNHYHVALGAVQFIFSLVMLFNSLKSFKKRVALILESEDK